MPWIEQAKRVGKIIAGTVLLLIGVALLVLPGPGFVGIIAGLAILSTEFAWAAWLLHRAKEKAEHAADSVLGPGQTNQTFWSRLTSRFSGTKSERDAG